MSLLYFHLRDGHDVLLDPEARAIIGEDAIAGRTNLDQRIDIEDEQQNIVHCFRFVDAIGIVLPVPEPAAGR